MGLNGNRGKEVNGEISMTKGENNRNLPYFVMETLLFSFPLFHSVLYSVCTYLSIKYTLTTFVHIQGVLL